MFHRSYELGTQYGNTKVDKYLIVYRGDHVFFDKHNKVENEFNKKGYKVTYDFCNCPGFLFNRNKGKKCRHIKILEELGWELKKKEDLSVTEKITPEVEEQWNKSFKENNIKNKKEQKWMIDNFKKLMTEYKVTNIKQAHLIWMTKGENI